MLIPARGKYGCGRWLTDIAAFAGAVFADQLVKGFNAFNAHQMIDFLARVGEMFTQVLLNFDAAFFQFGIQHLAN